MIDSSATFENEYDFQPHPVEAKKSWQLHVERLELLQDDDEEENADNDDDKEQQRQRRILRHSSHHHRHSKHNHHNHHESETVLLSQIEHDREIKYEQELQKAQAKAQEKAQRKHLKNLKRLYQNPGIAPQTQHGFMMDAGSTGSRLHLYEWEPRVLSSNKDVKETVAGRHLSVPSSQSRWTDRLRPGIAEFASIKNDDELYDAIANYFQPMLDFAQTVLREKSAQFPNFPIYFRATAGMRTLSKRDRRRVLTVVRQLFHNQTYCPFYFEDEYARVLSGEEEAIYGWTGINFVMGNLLPETQGTGTVVSPALTYGALDMGGASTQISYYEPDEDILANLFKLQIGHAKHWNLYAHSFLYYGLNEARNRLQAYLLADTTKEERLKGAGVYHPCLPGNSQMDVRLNIYIDEYGRETWNNHNNNFNNTALEASSSFYTAVLANHHERGDFDACNEQVHQILHLESNAWCDFAHRGECAVNSVYMPALPKQSNFFGEFLAFSNYYHIWDFLQLPTRASIQELYSASQNLCNMTLDELTDYNNGHPSPVDDDELPDFCFRSVYAYQLLHYGYGFELEESIVATDVLQGQKVGWALGAMLYELNCLPWTYLPNHKDQVQELQAYEHQQHVRFGVVLVLLIGGILLSLWMMLRARRQRQENAKYYTTDASSGERIPLKKSMNM